MHDNGDIWPNLITTASAARSDKALGRQLRAVDPVGAVQVTVNGIPVVLFSSNDYLGLSAHPDVRAAMAEAAQQVGCGPRGSALVCGHTLSHDALATALAALKGTESALLCPTGYAANIAALVSFAHRGSTIFSDALNHASIIDACQLARRKGASLQVYKHLDMTDLRERLHSCSGPKIIVTDALFSMDGDLAPLVELAELRDEFGALLMVDEAHSTLVFGKNGGGLAEHFGVADQVDLHVGTLSKALGAQGGFVAASERYVNHILNDGRPFVFSTALPVPVVEAARAAIRVAADGSLRDLLWENVAQFSTLLKRDLNSPIVPIHVGDAAEVVARGNRLLERGLHVVGIRPPTVPIGGSRLRIALSAAHTRIQLLHLARELA